MSFFLQRCQFRKLLPNLTIFSREPTKVPAVFHAFAAEIRQDNSETHMFHHDSMFSYHCFNLFLLEFQLVPSETHDFPHGPQGPAAEALISLGVTWFRGISSSSARSCQGRWARRRVDMACELGEKFYHPVMTNIAMENHHFF